MSERDDDELDDASLSSMRAVWLSMRDEEPPAAGMSALMAAAAAKADQMRPQASWWQRALAQLRRPPVLAFATVMLLVGGAVLVTRSTGDEKVASLSAEQAPSRELRSREDEAQNATTPSAPATAPVEEAPPPADPRPAPKTEPAKDVKATPRPPKAATKLERRGNATLDQAGKHEPDRDHPFDTGDGPKTGFSSREGKGDSATVLQAPGRADPATITPTAPPPPPPPPEKPAESKKPEPGEIVLSDSTRTQPAQAPNRAPNVASNVASNEQLARQAESAATRGDCAAVRAIVARLKQQDEAFFKARLGKNAAVAKCR